MVCTRRAILLRIHKKDPYSKGASRTLNQGSPQAAHHLCAHLESTVSHMYVARTQNSQNHNVTKIIAKPERCSDLAIIGGPSRTRTLDLPVMSREL